MGKKVQAVIAVLAIAFVILDSKTAIYGAGTGVKLCLKVIVPSLFPLFLLSNLLTRALWGTHTPFSGFAVSLFGIPKGAESLLIPAFLGGYPTGAQTVAQMYSAGNLSRKSAERLLMFCNNAGPAFIFGMVMPAFPEKRLVFILWLILTVSAWAVSRLFSGTDETATVPDMISPKPDIMQTSLAAIAKVCGWVVVFRTVIEFLNRWLFRNISGIWKCIITGAIDLSNGCSLLSSVEQPGERFLAAAVILSFGSICVVMQTQAVIGKLNIRAYLTGKILQAAFALLLAWLYFYRIWWLLLLPVSFLTVHRIRNYSRNSVQAGV